MGAKTPKIAYIVVPETRAMGTFHVEKAFVFTNISPKLGTPVVAFVIEQHGNLSGSRGEELG